MYKVSLQSVTEEFNLINMTGAIDLSDKFLLFPEINRPALQLAGFFDFFDSDRLQIIGLVEHTYMERLDAKTRLENLTKLFQRKIPCIVVCRDLPIFPEMLDIAMNNGTPVLRSAEDTSDFMSEVIKWLKVELAPRIKIHGVLVDVYGEGVLIMGESGIGKSEMALELIKRGHRLVADDSVEVKKVSNRTLVGSCPEILRYFIELRGIGIVDVKQMFGAGSVKTNQGIDFVMKLETWDDKKDYDRMGLEDEYVEFLGNKVVCYSIPIRPGRNLAVICESAAINHRIKRMGYRAAEDLSERVSKSFLKKNGEKLEESC